MSDTPRTDAMHKVYRYRSRVSGLVYDRHEAAGDCEVLVYVPIEDASQLERELAEKEAALLKAGFVIR